MHAKTRQASSSSKRLQISLLLVDVGRYVIFKKRNKTTDFVVTYFKTSDFCNYVDILLFMQIANQLTTVSVCINISTSYTVRYTWNENKLHIYIWLNSKCRPLYRIALKVLPNGDYSVLLFLSSFRYEEIKRILILLRCFVVVFVVCQDVYAVLFFLYATTCTRFLASDGRAKSEKNERRIAVSFRFSLLWTLAEPCQAWKCTFRDIQFRACQAWRGKELLTNSARSNSDWAMRVRPRMMYII